MRADAIGFDFAAFVAKRGGVFSAHDYGFADFFERASVPFEKFFQRQSVSSAAHSRLPQYSSAKRRVVTERSASVMTQIFVLSAEVW